MLQLHDGTFRELGSPTPVDYAQAEDAILKWQLEWTPRTTIGLRDQPTIVPNSKGQRPLENIVSSVVGRRRGGMQPANTSREEMFGSGAPMWPFLSRFGGPWNPLSPVGDTLVFETYPVLSMIAWLGVGFPRTTPPGGAYQHLCAEF